MRRTLLAALLIFTLAFSGCVQNESVPVQTRGAENGPGEWQRGSEDHGGIRLGDQVNQLPKQELSEGEIAGILYMREVEKLARDGYGTFTNPELQRLYDELVRLGNKSEVEALKVGEMIQFFKIPQQL